MAVNVTYLLGAGASFEALPLVKDIRYDSGAIKKIGLGRHITVLAEQLESLPDGMKNSSCLDAIKKLKDLSSKSIKYSSPDTYIRSLWLKKNKQGEIETAKKTLSFYLTVEQLKDKEPNLDSRYIPFLSSILENKNEIQFPENVKIISWNYDFQLELALQFFLDIKLNEIQSHFGIIPSEHHLDSPNIIHLNGIAGQMKDNEKLTSFIKTEYAEQRNERLAKFIEIYNYLNSRYSINDLFSFAWELTDHDRIVSAKEILEDTQILVIIGYSFPFFNREVDNQLFKSFIKNNEVNELHDLKIYIQDPSINEDQIYFLRERFEIPEEIDIEPIKSVDQFFLPPSL
jgi:hypothetical protein